MTGNDPIRLGFIGCGGCGCAHAYHTAKSPASPWFEHRWYMDLSAETAGKVAKVYGARPTTRLDDLLGDSETDAVVISTYHDTHVPLCIQAAEAGKHIFVEKPLSLTSQEGFQAREAVEKHGVKLMVGFCFIHSPLVARIKEVMPRVTTSVVHGMVAGRSADDSWGVDAVRGGGPVFSNTCHNIALMLRLHDARPVQVAAHGGEFTRQTGIPDAVTATISFEDGSSSSYVGVEIGGKGKKQGGRPPHFGKWVAIAIGGEIHATICDRFQSVHFGGDTDAEDMHIDDYGPAKGMVAELEAWARWIREDAPPVGGTVEDGILTTLIWEKMCESIRTGTSQDIPDIGGQT